MTTATVAAAWSKVMGDVQGIGKRDRNDQQRFNFRGIDAVMNAVGPALREHGVSVIPTAHELINDTYSTKSGTVMRNATVRIGWTIIGPLGDTIDGASYGEAADAGDKAVSKAHSVAYRTFLLQALCIPTDEPDPDASGHERSAALQRPAQPQETPREQSPASATRDITPASAARDDLRQLLVAKDIPLGEALVMFRAAHEGDDLPTTTDVPAIRALIEHYTAEPKP